MAALTAADFAPHDEEATHFIIAWVTQTDLFGLPGPYPLVLDASLAPDSAGAGTVTITSVPEGGATLLQAAAHLRTVLGMPAEQVDDMITETISQGAFCVPSGAAAAAWNYDGSYPWQGTWWNGDPTNKANWTDANIETVFGITNTHLTQTIATGNVPAGGGGGGGGGGGPAPGSGQPISTNNARGYPSIVSTGVKLLEPNNEYPSMCGVTSYNIVDGHFFLKSLPTPLSETVTKTVQGVNDNFESKYEDIGVEAIFDRLEKKYKKRANP